MQAIGTDAPRLSWHTQSWEYDKLMIVHFTSITRARSVLASRHIALQPTSGFLGDGGADCLVSIMLLSSAKKNGDPEFPRMLSTERRCSPTIVRFVSDRGHLDVYNIFEAQHTILNSILPVHICSKCMKTMGTGPRGLRVVTWEGRTRAKCLAHLLLLPAKDAAWCA